MAGGIRKISTGTGGGSIGLAPMATGTGRSRSTVRRDAGSANLYRTIAKATSRIKNTLANPKAGPSSAARARQVAEDRMLIKSAKKQLAKPMAKPAAKPAAKKR